MLHLVIVLAVVSSTFAEISPNDFAGRIIGGVNTTIEEHPYQCSLQVSSNGHFCGCSIIGKTKVLTAAHCMRNRTKEDFKVRLGSTSYNHGGILVAVKAIHVHEGYDPTILINDVAVITLAKPVLQSSTIHYAKLAKEPPRTGTKANVTGWGLTCFGCNFLPPKLNVALVTVMNQTDCAKQTPYSTLIRESMCCAAGDSKDSCQGDSGGPLVVGNIQIGIVSWGYGCAFPDYPGVYSSVSWLRDWIRKQ